MNPQIMFSSLLCAWAFSFLIVEAPVFGQAQSPVESAAVPPNPVNHRLRIPRAKPKPGGDRLALVPSESGSEPVVARVYLEVGDYFVTLMPDGRIRSLPQREATITERPFEPLSRKEMEVRLKQSEFPGFKTRSTRRYVYCYNTSEAFAKGTGRILETMYPGLVAFCKKNGLKISDPEFPLVIVMFKTEAEFRKTTGMEGSIAAFYNGVSNYVFMYEQADNAAAAPELALKQSISTIAHEGVHQILHNIGVQQRLSRWPLWISEGLPEYFAPTDVGKRVRWKGVGLVNDLRLHTLKADIDNKRGRPAMIEPTVTAKSLDAVGYARAWAITHYLASRERKKFQRLLQQVSKLEPLGPPPEPAEIFDDLFGDGYEGRDQALWKHLSTLPYVDPVANQTHYVGMAQQGGRRATVISSSRESIDKFRREAGGNVMVKAFPNLAAAKQFAARWRSGR